MNLSRSPYLCLVLKAVVKVYEFHFKKQNKIMQESLSFITFKIQLSLVLTKSELETIHCKQNANKTTELRNLIHDN